MKYYKITISGNGNGVWFTDHENIEMMKLDLYCCFHIGLFSVILDYETTYWIYSQEQEHIYREV